jgi:hypothetical protein
MCASTIESFTSRASSAPRSAGAQYTNGVVNDSAWVITPCASIRLMRAGRSQYVTSIGMRPPPITKIGASGFDRSKDTPGGPPCSLIALTNRSGK